MSRATVPWLALCLAAAPLPALAAAPRQHAGDSNTPALFSADEVQYDQDLGLVVAKGHVEISQRDQILLADTVTYNQRTDTVTASGHVTLLQPGGDIVFADYAELHDDMRDGFIRNVRMLLSDRSRLAGNTARRIDGNRTELRRGVYSPCDLCREDPSRAPIWQIKAEEITHDKELQIVEYRDAVMEIDGVPILWSPYFSHPDPSVKRRSGFLAPTFGSSSSLGIHTSLPYYWAISPDSDATFEPMLTTSGGTYFGGEYRQRWGSARVAAAGSITVGSQSQTGVDQTLTAPASGVRGHLFANSELDLNEDWRAGLDVQRASDQTYLLRYHLPSPTNFLTSHLYAEDFGERSYGNISSWAWQSLRTGVGDSTEPIVAPVADYIWTSDPDVLGGRLALQGNVLNLLRIQGISTQRLSTGGEWRYPFDGLIGDRYGLTVGVRTDGYHSTDLPVTGSANLTESAIAGRVFPQAALTWRYPWVRRGDGYSQTIEPIAMLAAAPNGGNPATIPNEDSQGFEFDETSLFLRNRFPGLDRVDSGQRVDYGLRTGVYADGGGSARLLVGQSYAFEKNSAFLPGSGLEDHLSDVVGRVTISPSPYFDLIYRFRLDHADLALRREEVAFSTGPANLRLGLSYIDIAAIPDVPSLPKRRQVSASVTTTLTHYWSLALTGTRDFAQGQVTLNSGIALTYRDECIAFVTSLTQSGVNTGDVHPGTSLLFTIVFKNLGEIGSRLASFGGSS